MTVIYLVRHGQTACNKDNLLQATDSDGLDRVGIRQANKLCKKFMKYDVDICFCSPFIRTMQTAFTLVGDRCLIIKDDRLKERYLGDFEGKDIALYDFKKYWDYNLNSCDSGVEKIQDIYKRCEEFLDDICEKYKDKSILIVSHVAIIKCMQYILKDMDREKLYDVDICNCYFEKIEI